MAEQQQTLFDLPNSPDQFSVLLPPSELRKVDFSALEFSTARRAIIEYIKTYFPDDFNDFVTNNGVMMLVELMSYLTGVLSLRSDLLSNEGFLPTAVSEDAVVNHLALIGQRIRRATPAVIDVECSVSDPAGADIRIPARKSFVVSGEDGDPITYEIFRSPNDLNSDIVIPAGKRAVIAYGVEGRTEETIVSSEGTSGFKITVNSGTDQILDAPISVNVSIGDSSEDWNRIDIIETAGPNDKVFEVRFFDGRTEFVFGDNVAGSIPPNGATITLQYRVGGGVRGRIGTGIVDEARPVQPQPPFTAPVSVRFRNVAPSSGGTDKESLDNAKKRAPRDFATRDSAITSSDYSQIVANFSHPVFGSVSKAISTVKTGLNANRVELYVLAEGPDGPVAPNEGLKRSITTRIDEVNVLTDHVVVLDGKIQPVDIKMTVVVNRNADASITQTRVDAAIEDFFNINNWDLGQPLFVSQLYDVITAIDGVKYVDIFEPVDNILASGQLDGPDETIDINEIVALGNKEISLYYEDARQ